MRTEEELFDYEVTVVLARGKGDERETRSFTLVIPATTDAGARHGAYQIGLGVNEASDFQWKLADLDNWITVRKL